MDRRDFIRSAAWFTVAGAVATLPACGGHDDGHPPPPGGSHSFPQGVASGDPKESSVVFWTRCLGPSSLGTDLRLEVSSSAAFDPLVAAVELTAMPRYDFTVRAKVTGLAPGTRYYYRFIAGQDRSPAGETRTAPAAGSSPQQLRFAWLSCQDWSTNHWGALDLLAQEEPDFIVHVGDYVYEMVGSLFQGPAEPAHPLIVLPNGERSGGLEDGIHAVSLLDYRTLYRTYRGDRRLQELHRRFPLIAIWDDHEFSDDCWRDHETYTNANRQQTARRRAANQAWAEYMPVDLGDISFDLDNPAYDNIRIYRDFRFGSLVHLVMTDERLYRDDHVVSEQAVAGLLGHDRENGDDRVGARIAVPQTLLSQFERLDELQLGRLPSILGEAQSQWWKDTLKGSTATWKVWGNEVPLNRMWVDLRGSAPPPLDQVYILDADAWDGYPGHRAELMGFLKNEGIGNVVALSGDIHAFQCGVVRDNQDPAVGTPVAVDFVTAGVSSASLFQSLARFATDSVLTRFVTVADAFNDFIRRQNPDLVYADHDAQGYAMVTVTANAFAVVYNKVKPLNLDGTAPGSPLAKRTRITLAAGSTTPVVEDNV